MYNEAAEIGRLVGQLKPYRNECEIIIVDGESTDGTPGKIREYAGEASRDILVLEEKKGRSLQMNAGAGKSTGDILFFLHCDCTLPEKFLEEIRRVMAANDWGCFRVKFPSSNFFMLTNCIISNHRALCRRLPFGDQGIFINRDLFFEAGMFPEIPLMEDYEFSIRMKRRKGVRGPGMTRKWLITSARRYGRGTGSILRTEMQMWKLRRMYRVSHRSHKEVVLAEFQRRDIWQRAEAETKRLAAGRPVWAIKCPDSESRLTSDIPFISDYAYCMTLKKALENEGIYAVVQMREDWYCDIGADVEILIGCRYDYHPDRRVPERTNVMWMVCHPDNASVELLDRFDLVLDGLRAFG